MKKMWLRLLLVSTFFSCFFTVVAQQISPSLWEALQSDSQTEFLVLFKAQAKLDDAPSKGSKEARGRYVYEQTQSLAERTQAPLRDWLSKRGVSYRPFFVVNAMWVEGDKALAQAIAARPEVASLQGNPHFMLDVLPAKAAALSSGLNRNSEDVEWGVEKIGAPLVWAMGFTGQDVVIGGQDTGYEWDHPALVDTYRGWDGDTVSHDYNWHDAIHQIDSLNGEPYEAAANPCGLNSLVPCDDNNHGTHTMGTMAGGESDEGKKIGVAPDAKWIGCRNMERGWGSPASYIECFEWFLAPTTVTGEAPDPAKAPHVINNSWACPAIEGCTPENFELMRQVVDNLKAAGIVVVVSAGNSGSQCHTISTPAAIFSNSFTVGATQETDTIANFSSRGTVTIDSSGRLKPNVAAPGVGVRSAIRNGGFASFSGTSMAGPHVAGAVALLISANPELAGQVELIESLLEQTAKPMLSDQDCGGQPGDEVPNPVYGYGRIDIAAAVEAAMEVTATNAIETADGLSFFPNPTADGHLRVQRQQAWPNTAQVQIVDSQGRIVSRQVWPATETQLQLDLSSLPGGLYLFQLSDGQRLETGKLLKKN
jgi:subtilisin family serine protease